MEDVNIVILSIGLLGKRKILILFLFFRVRLNMYLSINDFVF